MSAVRDWLEEIGLAQYADVFEANDIDTDLLTLVAPRRIIIHAVRRVCYHQVRLDAAEHALDVRRDRAVAAEDAVPPEHPQIARPTRRVRAAAVPGPSPTR
jgi:SAM domain (Sterile alpha motif)